MKYNADEVSKRFAKRIGCRPKEAKLIVETLFDVIREIMWEEDTESLVVFNFFRLDRYIYKFNKYSPLVDRIVEIEEPRVKCKLSRNLSRYKHQLNLLEFEETNKTP